MTTEEYLLENLCCANCASQIEEQVQRLENIDTAHIDFIKKKLIISYQKDKDYEQAIKKIVKSIEPDVTINQISQTTIKPKSPIPYSLISAGLGVIVLLIANVLNPPSEVNFIMLLTAYILSCWKVLYNALLKAFKGRIFDEHFLMSIASLGALYLGEYHEAVAVMVLYEIGQFFENKAVNHSRNSIQSMLSLKPDIAHRVIGNKIDDIALADIVLNEQILVLPGERVPLDGIIIQGESTLDTSALTGEALPLSVTVGESVLSGTMNLSGSLTIKVTSTDANSTVSRILDLVDKAAARKSKTERFITRFAKKYTPSVVLLAIIIALIPPVFSDLSHNVWFKRALIFLIVSCPCALIISIPLTNYAAIGAAARKGILFKGSNFIDALSRATAFVYDKTGTLTTGRLAVHEIYPAEGVSEEQLISAAMTCESNSKHIIATAIKNKFGAVYQSEPNMLHHEFSGKGIKAQTLNSLYYAGSRAFMVDNEIINLPSEPTETCIFIAEKNQFIGFITFKDEIKTDFLKVIKTLKKMGIKKHIMLTGDHYVQAQQVAKALLIDKFFARLLPEDKMQKLETIEQSQISPVAFIGDGINDAPVISRAEIGIAMGAVGSQAAIEAADVVLMNDEPMQLLSAFKMARKTRSIMWQNIIFAFGVKFIVMAIGTMGIATLWEAVIADVGVTLIAIANSLRLLRS